MGILDQFVSARLLDRYPQLYSLGQTNQFFRLRVFIAWIANAVYHSLMLYIWGELLWPYDLVQGDGRTAGHWVWGTAMYGAVLLTVLGKAGLITNNWTKYHVIAIPGSMALFLGFIAAYATVGPIIGISTEYHGLVPRLFSSPVFWLQMLCLPVLCLFRDVTWKYAKRMYRPQTYHHIQEIQKYNIQDYRPRYVLASNHTKPTPGFILELYALLMPCTVWNNSKKRSARFAKSSECANKEATPSRRLTSLRLVCSRRMTRRRTEEGMERWPLRDHRARGKGGNDACLRQPKEGKRTTELYTCTLRLM